MYTPCSVTNVFSGTGPVLELHFTIILLLAVECVGPLGVMYMESLVFVVVISSPGTILLTKVVYVQLLVITGVKLEEETSVTPVVLLLQLVVYFTCGQLELLMLMVAV